MSDVIKAYQVATANNIRTQLFPKKIKISVDSSEIVIRERENSREIFRAPLSEVEIGESITAIAEIDNRKIQDLIFKHGQNFVRVRFLSPKLTQILRLILGIAAFVFLLFTLGKGTTVIYSVLAATIFTFVIVPEFNRHEFFNKNRIRLVEKLVGAGVWKIVDDLVVIPKIPDPDLASLGERMKSQTRSVFHFFFLLILLPLNILVFSILPRVVLVDPLIRTDMTVQFLISLLISMIVIVPITLWAWRKAIDLENRRVDLIISELKRLYKDGELTFEEVKNVYERSYKITKRAAYLAIASASVSGIMWLIAFGAAFILSPKVDLAQGQQVSETFITALGLADYTKAQQQLCSDVEGTSEELAQDTSSHLKIFSSGQTSELDYASFQYKETSKWGSRDIQYTFVHKSNPENIHLNTLVKLEDNHPCIYYSNVLLGSSLSIRYAEIGHTDNQWVRYSIDKQ